MTDLEEPDFSRDDSPVVPSGSHVRGDKGPAEQQPTTEVNDDSHKEKNESSATASSGAGDTVPPGQQEKAGNKHWVPARVKKVLEESQTFDQFRRNRKFRYLHLFSGEEDQLAIALKVEAQKQMLEIHVESLDRKRDKELNLTDPKVFDDIDATVDEGEWDGIHSGFPCSSFSRVRWRDATGGAPPVRSKDHIYGLPGNTISQQAEADRGTLMASRSAWIHKKQIASSRKRGIPEVSTMENPPGSENSGSAWDLPEMQQVVNETKSSEVEFHTCAYMSSRERWYKPSRWTGKLEDLTGLARVCRCPNWVKHVPVIGKTQTEAAGAYPPELASEVAKRIVATWKRILNLEWWRHRIEVGESEVSELQKKWLANEEKRRKRLYEEKEPIYQNSLSASKKAKLVAKATEANEQETDKLPSSSWKESKREFRERENDFYIGGMRNPAVSVSRLNVVRSVGKRITEEWKRFSKEHPRVLAVASAYGSRQAELDKELLAKWKGELKKILEVKEQDGITLKSNLTFQSPLDPEMWDGWRRTARDPEQHIVQWIREGVPLGMEEEIPSSDGIFPPVAEQETMEDKMDMDVLEDLRNYESVESQKDEAAIEIDRYLSKGFCKVLPTEVIQQLFPDGTASRLALILKEKPDGSTKRRIVIDLKRSNGNNRSQVPERLTLPRPSDVAASLRVMRDRSQELAQEDEERKRQSHHKGNKWEEEQNTEFFLLDLKDAFCHFGVAEKELRHCVSPGLEPGTGIIWCAMLFGFKAAPLLMARLASAIGRLLQSLFHPARCQIQIYVDDVMMIVKGDRPYRANLLALALYTLGAFGVQLSLDKGERGKRVTWIGTGFELEKDHLVLATPKKMVSEIKLLLGNWKSKGMVPLKELRTLAGKLAWVAGIAPRVRWVVSTVYGVLTAAEMEQDQEEERAKRRRGDQRPKKGLVALKRLGTSLPWLTAAMEKPEVFLLRREPLVEVQPKWGIVTDASPFGLGAILIHKVSEEWQIVAAFEAPITEAEAKLLGVEYKEASGQSALEALAIIRAVQGWGLKFKGEPVIIRSDSSVALAMLRKLASPNKILNYLAAELSLMLEELQVPRLVLQHIPGQLNKETDWLSRPNSRSEPPPEALRSVKIVKEKALVEQWFACPPPGAENSPWKDAVPHSDGVFDTL